MSSDILTARKGPVLEITLNRPQIGNAASDAMAVELTKLLLGGCAAATTWCSTATARSAAAKSR